MTTPSDSVVVFDLDDTLFDELDYVHSGFDAVGSFLEAQIGSNPASWLRERFEPGRDVFGELCSAYSLPDETAESLLEIYRQHAPSLKPRPGAKAILDSLRDSPAKIGLLTDGRSTTQRAKVDALGLDEYFDEVVISEEFGSSKPSEENYRYFERAIPASSFWYIADNYAKDFVTANKLGWHTVGVLDPGRNIHRQDASTLAQTYLPQHEIFSLAALTFEFTY